MVNVDYRFYHLLILCKYILFHSVGLVFFYRLPRISFPFLSKLLAVVWHQAQQRPDYENKLN